MIEAEAIADQINDHGEQVVQGLRRRDRASDVRYGVQLYCSFFEVGGTLLYASFKGLPQVSQFFVRRLQMLAINNRRFQSRAQVKRGEINAEAYKGKHDGA